MLLMGTRWRDSLYDCNTQAGNAGGRYGPSCPYRGSWGHLPGRQCLPSITLPENPIFPLPNMAPCVHNTRTAENKEVLQPAERGASIGHTGRKACSQQLIPLLRESRHITGHQGGKHTGHIHTPLGYTAPLDSAGSLNSLTSNLPFPSTARLGKD